MSNNVDVMIRTHTPLTDEQFEAVASQVQAMEGIVEFQRNARLPSFIMVVYNAGQTKALAILNKLTRLGFNASLIAG